MKDLFDLLMNAQCSVWKKIDTGVVDTYGIQPQDFTLLTTGIPCRADPGDGKELDTEAAFGTQTFTFFMRPIMVDAPPRPLNIHDWLQINSVTDMLGNVTTYPLDVTVSQMFDIQNIKNPGLLGHHWEIQAKLIEP